MSSDPEYLQKRIEELEKERDYFLLQAANSGYSHRCPFCLGSGYVPYLKFWVREKLCAAWAVPVTKEEIDKRSEGVQE